MNALVPALLRWFAESARDLPWRRTRDPYAIWVSEIMLQQTQVKTVIPYWERWMQALPTIEALATANPEKIHKLWEGLGYYTRVRNMQKAAQEIVAKHNAQFPQDFDSILALQGIGRYTAGAIASIAFNQPQPILDGNVIRVLTRLYAISENPRDKITNEKLWKLARELVSAATQHAPRSIQKQACSHLNQSLMELGALICTPKPPKCLLCPVRQYCEAFRIGKVEEFPNLGERTVATSRRFFAFIFEHRGRFLIRQRPAGIVNAHLWEFPNFEVSTTRNPDPSQVVQANLGFITKSLAPLCTIKHSITRYRITLEAFRGTFAAVPKKINLNEQWRTLEELHHLPFPSAHKKIIKCMDDHKALK
ncbi:MAG: A/G-specific adenine glycosylase [Pedosphaera sp.]|nr:A/G-specific adenine glycosylase [Pedosphaera sp.]